MQVRLPLTFVELPSILKPVANAALDAMITACGPLPPLLPYLINLQFIPVTVARAVSSHLPHILLLAITFTKLLPVIVAIAQ